MKNLDHTKWKQEKNYQELLKNKKLGNKRIPKRDLSFLTPPAQHKIVFTTRHATYLLHEARFYKFSVLSSNNDVLVVKEEFEMMNVFEKVFGSVSKIEQKRRIFVHFHDLRAAFLLPNQQKDFHLERKRERKRKWIKVFMLRARYELRDRRCL